MGSEGKKQPSQVVLNRELEEFLIDREAQNASPKTLEWYQYALLQTFRNFMVSQDVERTEDITPGILRRYIIHLSDRGHNPGGVANVYSAAKVYLNWFTAEYSPAGWVNPLTKVKPPRKTKEIEQPISPEDFRALLKVCDGNTFLDARDSAIFYVLLDSGIRRQELADLNVGDVDMKNGDVLVQSGKGRKTRYTFVSAKTRRALAKYFRFRDEAHTTSPLWVTARGERLKPSGLRQIVRRRAEAAGIECPGFHDFRRAFAVNALRSGMDLVTLQRMLGHADLNVINRYLALVGEDLRRAHAEHSPVDHMLDDK